MEVSRSLRGAKILSLPFHETLLHPGENRESKSNRTSGGESAAMTQFDRPQQRRKFDLLESIIIIS